MKRIFAVLMISSLCAAPGLRGQDAATEERLNKLSGQVEDLQAANVKLQKQCEELARRLQELREAQTGTAGSYASQEDLKRLAEKVQEMDRKREADKDLILKEIEKLGKAAIAPAPPPRNRKPPVEDPPPAPGSDKGFEYFIKDGDKLSLIAQAYREKGIKITVDQILKANPGLNPNKLKVGQKIFIPAPKP